MEELKEMNKWLISMGLSEQYMIKLKQDTMLGNLFELFSLFNNGAKSFVMETPDIEEIKSYILIMYERGQKL